MLQCRVYKYFITIALVIVAQIWDLTQWQAITQQCSYSVADTLTMRCESAGLVTKQWYSGAIDVSVDVLAFPVGTVSQYWTGLALNGNVAIDDNYAEIALTQQIEPFTTVTTPSAVILSTTGKDNCCQIIKQIDPALWHTLRIQYNNGKATYSIDGISKQVNVHLVKYYQIELLCVAVNPGTHVDGALTQCQFKNLRVHDA